MESNLEAPIFARASHTLSDILTSAVAYIDYKTGMKPADMNHHYGSGSAEFLVGLVVAVFQAEGAFEILQDVYYKLNLGSAFIPLYNRRDHGFNWVIGKFNLNAYLVEIR